MTSRRLLRISLVTALLLAAGAAEARRFARTGESPAIRQARGDAASRTEEARAAGPLRGLVLGVYSDRDGESWRRELDQLAGLGASHVLVVVQHAITDVRSTEIGPREWLTPSTGRLDEVLAGVRERGLGLVLMPTLYVENTGDGQWRGALEPEDWDDWWRSYDRFVVRHARLAQRHGAEVFIAGSELCSTESQRERWARLLVRLRSETDALLGYSFNWDHLRQGRIADLFDLVGMNAYHDLAPGPGTPVDELVASWTEVRAEVEGWRSEHGRPLLFTEVGYRSVEIAEREPWNYLWEQPYDGRAQARCYRAFLEAWSDHPELAGVFFYSWRGEGGRGDTGYTPRGKPAEVVLRRWLSDQPLGVPAPIRPTEMRDETIDRPARPQ